MRNLTFAALMLLCSFSTLSAEQVFLKNGDVITGTILNMDGKKLVVKTAYAGPIPIDMSAVDHFTSAAPMVVTTASSKTLTGTVAVQGDNYVVTTASGTQTMPRSDIAFLRSPADQTAYEKALHPGMLEGWKGAGNFGVAFARGNSQTTNLTLGLDAQRKTTNDGWTIGATSIYATDAKLGATTANAFQAAIRYDRNLNKRLFLFGTFGGGYDQLQDLDYRILPGGGLGVHAITGPRTTLDLLSGIAYDREAYSTGLIRNLTTATLGDEFSFHLNSRTKFIQNVYYLPYLNDTGNYRANGNAGISTKLNGWMTANLLFNDQYNSQPVLGNKKNDVLFTSGLGFTFGPKAK